MSGRYRDLPHIPGGQTTAVVGEPDARGWRTILTTGLYKGYPMLAGFEVQDQPSITTTPPAEVRCPECGKKLGERLVGTYTTTCPRCKKRITITR